MFTEVLEAWDASIRGVTIKMNDGSFQIRIKVQAQFTPDLAVILGCRDSMFLENGAPREGIVEADLDGGCAAFQGILTVDGLKQEFQMNGDSISDLTVKRSGKDGLRLEMRLNYTGEPLTFIAYWKEVGAAAGVCKIRPLQKELEAADDVKAELTIIDPRGNRTTVAVPNDTLRHAVMASGRKTKTGVVN